MSVGAVVLAAGQGTRMRSALPKVLHPLAGRPMVLWVLGALRAAGVAPTVVVVGHGAEDVRRVLPGDVAVAVQERQLGTGDAAAVGLAALDGAVGTVVIASGDTPLLSEALLRRLLAAHGADGAGATMVTALLPDAGAYGRVVREPDGRVRGVVEARDATAEQLAVGEVNVGLYAADRVALEAALGRVGSDNAQGELYLPDALPLLGRPVAALAAGDAEEVAGVNDRVDLAACEASLQRRLREDLMRAGVTMPDPGAVWVDAGVRVGADTVLWPGTHLRGDTRIGARCQIGPDALLADSEVGDDCTVVSAHVLRSTLEDGCRVGPFAYLRPGNVLRRGARVGTHVEVKGSEIGPGARVPHLSYVGDTTIGEGTNIGAGNITANYDGFRKHRTQIGARVRTGSDCVFVAPVTVGDDAMTAAGSIITDEVPAGALGIARARQSVIEGFTARAAEKARAAAERARAASE